jgi:hypothetical protein
VRSRAPALSVDSSPRGGSTTDTPFASGGEIVEQRVATDCGQADLSPPECAGRKAEHPLLLAADGRATPDEHASRLTIVLKDFVSYHKDRYQTGSE